MLGNQNHDETNAIHGQVERALHGRYEGLICICSIENASNNNRPIKIVLLCATPHGCNKANELHPPKVGAPVEWIKVSESVEHFNAMIIVWAAVVAQSLKLHVHSVKLGELIAGP